MSTRDTNNLGTYTLWAEAFSSQELTKRLNDQAQLKRGQLCDGNNFTRTTPAGLSRRAYDNVRANRVDMDNREWNSDTGFSGVNRWPKDPGMQGQGQGVQTPAEIRRRKVVERLDDGF